jgi:hypothetical protein
MPNTQVPILLQVDAVSLSSALVSWQIPDPSQAAQLTFNIYTSSSSGGQFHGPITNVIRQKAALVSPLTSSPYYITITSFNIVTGLESESSEVLYVSALSPANTQPFPADGFNIFWTQVVSPGLQVDVQFIDNTLGTTSYYLTGLYNTGIDAARWELKRSGSLVWRGRTNSTNVDMNPLFPEGAIVILPGQTLVMSLYHSYISPVEFSGNLFGFNL